MGTQSLNGKAFEFACLDAFYRHLSPDQPVEIEKTLALEKAKDAFKGLDDDLRLKCNKAANAAVRILVKLEPQLGNPMGNTPLFLSIQEDAKGQAGDVRDIVAIRRQNGWEIGVSAKHNHAAVKHSRLSKTIDFGKQWFGIPCSEEYFNDIRPIFEELEGLKAEQATWNQIPDKKDKYYVPVLNAFMQELKRLDAANPVEVPLKMLSYLLGKHDFYKVIANDSRQETMIQGFSLYGTLNKPAGRVQPQAKLKNLRLPNCFYDINFKRNSKTTILVACDEGWTISLRLHNAESRIIPSLKFDVKLIGIPPALYTHHESW